VATPACRFDPLDSNAINVHATVSDSKCMPPHRRLTCAPTRATTSHMSTVCRKLCGTLKMERAKQRRDCRARNLCVFWQRAHCRFCGQRIPLVHMLVTWSGAVVLHRTKGGKSSAETAGRSQEGTGLNRQTPNESDTHNMQQTAQRQHAAHAAADRAATTRNMPHAAATSMAEGGYLGGWRWPLQSGRKRRAADPAAQPLCCPPSLTPCPRAPGKMECYSQNKLEQMAS
jgi:hypothetical protein